MSLPNKITVFRLLLSPLLFYLLMTAQSTRVRAIAFFVFLAAALSDLYDGYLARKRGDVTEVGKIIDPLADKCLLAAALLAFYLLRDSTEAFVDVSIWVILILLGRELIIMIVRYLATNQGKYLPASGIAKVKTLCQNFFIGSVLVRYVHLSINEEYQEFSLQSFDHFHRYLNSCTLWLVVFLTTVSGIMYIVKFRHLIS
jgi:CDP-diacylglycerol--glycerol-3-phosphate 3-phosphatidyltransferase